ncbi:hypothetical protein V1502_02780 [Bacillus sp. SCS-153A]|uniref:hypothetical protein n=1 Tax=Rossellomorea sedimentorum TaxID=3115294 RepID=UPI0039063E15
MNIPPCPCGCGKSVNACKSSPLSVKVMSQTISSPEERAQIIENVQIGSTFNMRMRGHLLFYGKDLTGYAKSTTVTPNTTNFLHLLSNFLYAKSDHGPLDSWNDCSHAFWDEFITTYCLYTLKLSHKEKEAERFLFQLTKFGKWMDTHRETSLLAIILPSIEAHKPDVILCEKILNRLLKNQFPNLLDKNWNRVEALDKMKAAYSRYTDVVDGLFEVTGIIEKVVVIKHLETNQSYTVKGLTSNLLKPQLLLDGEIGRRFKETKWNWFFTLGVYPQLSRDYLSLQMETGETSLYPDSSLHH